MKIPVSTKIVEEIINYAEDKVNTPTDSSKIASEFINYNDFATQEEIDEEVKSHEDYDDGYRQAMQHILNIIEKHLK